MSLRLGETAPDFTTQTTFGKIQFHDWLGDSWGLLFSHPENYTPVCTTEIGVVANLQDEFAKRNVKCIGLSVDSVESHHKWIVDIEDIIGHQLNFPIISDSDKQIAHKYQMIHSLTDANFTIRSVFIIGADKKIRLILTYPMAVGRNFDEILRVIDSLQLSEDYDIVTPANWKQGGKVIVAPSVDTTEVQTKEGFEEVKPYLRYINHPQTKSVT